MSFGGYPEISLGSYSKKHGEARKLLASRVDPMAERKVARSAAQAAKENSFASIASQWLEHWSEGSGMSTPPGGVSKPTSFRLWVLVPLRRLRLPKWSR